MRLARDTIALDSFASATRRTLLALLVVACSLGAWPQRDVCAVAQER